MPSVVLAVLGVWNNERDIRKALLLNKEEYSFSCGWFYKYDRRLSINAHLSVAEEDIEEQLYYMGKTPFTPVDIMLAKTHRSVLYLNININNVDDLVEVMEIGRILFDAGGILIKIHSSGVAYTHHQWNSLIAMNSGSTSSKNLMENLYMTFVNVYAGPNFIESVGMGTFGLPDVVFETGELDLKTMLDHLHSINLFQLIDKVEFNPDELFKLVEYNLHFRFNYKDDDLRFVNGDVRKNSSGYWRMERID